MYEVERRHEDFKLVRCRAMHRHQDRKAMFGVERCMHRHQDIRECWKYSRIVKRSSKFLCGVSDLVNIA